MDFQIRSQYKYGVTTTTSLMGSGAAVMDGYYPADGNDEETPVIDTFDVWLNGTAAENRAKLREIRLALESAKEFWGTARQAYLYYDVDDSAVWWRSPIKSGRVVHNPRLLHEINRARMRITVVVERAPWWEKDDSEYIPLSNGNGTDETTDGLRVYNSNDHAVVDTSYYRDAYATIDGVNDVDGDLPAPIDFHYVNNADLDVHIRTIHTWNDKNSNPAGYSGLIEAEVYGTPVALTGASGGNVASYTIPDATETLFWSCDIDPNVAYSKGQNFILAMRFKYDQIANLASLKFKIEVYESTYGSMLLSDWFYPMAATGYPVMVVSPPFKLAPIEIGWVADTSLNGYTLRLYAYQESGSSIALICDDFHLLPVPLKGYRKIGSEKRDTRIGFGYYQKIYDTQSQLLTYEEYITTEHRQFVLPNNLGSVYVYPGVTQRLNWLFGMTTATTQTMINSAYLRVYAKYRPRRRTI